MNNLSPRKLISGGNQKILGWAILIFLALVWGSSFILIKRGLLAFSPSQVGGLRLSVAGLVAIPLVWGKAHRVPAKAWIWIIVVGVVGNAIPAVLFPFAETKLNSATVGVLNSMSPIFVLIFGFLFFQFRFSLLQVLGVAMGFGGVLMLILLGDQEISMEDNLLYTGAAVLATVGYGLTTNVMKRFLQDVPATIAPTFALLFMGLPFAIYLLIAGNLGEAFSTHGSQAWISLGYIVILGALGTALALVLFYKLVQISDPIIAASVTYLIPIVALFWGWVDGEHLTPLQYLGISIILGGVWLVNRKKA